MSFNPQNDIEPEEVLFRMVRPWDRFWKEGRKKLSTAAFKSPNGLSVDRDGNRTNEKIISDFLSRNFEGALISGAAGKCLEAKVYLLKNPSKSNIYHALILDSPQKKLISTAKCEKLVKIFRIVKEDISSK